MRKNIFVSVKAILFFSAGVLASFAFAGNFPQEGFILDHEKDVAVNQPGPHAGGGSTIAYNFFDSAKDCNLIFRKRVLHPGAAIGYHLQTENEIYYIISGAGEMKMNGKIFQVNAGDAILTLPGSSHSLTQAGAVDLVMIINYEKKSGNK